MSEILFYLFATLMIGFGLAVVVNRNPVTSALCLVGSFLGLAALFVLLDAFFIATIQVMVYAGAVMVLFVFIIMLLDLKAEARRRFNFPTLVGGAAISLVLGWQILTVVDAFQATDKPMPPLDFPVAAAARSAELGESTTPDSILTNLQKEPASLPDIRLVGEQLFTRFPLHLQVVAVLLLVATLGVVLLSKRRLS